MIAFFPSRAVALELFGFSIHWYGIMYLLAFIIAGYLLPRLQNRRNLPFTRDEWWEVLTYLILGVIIGGRLGYVFLYDPMTYWRDPLEILAVWHGGMSFHGGLIGVIIAAVFASWWKHVSFLSLMDVLVVPACIGLALGRFGNFINQELYGTVTTLPWGIMIPGVEGLRHPAQLYSMTIDLLNAALCYWHLSKTGMASAGKTSALFLLLYGVGRFAVEYVRVQQYPLVDLFGWMVTRGQLYTIPMFILGIVLWGWVSCRRSAK